MSIMHCKSSLKNGEHTYNENNHYVFIISQLWLTSHPRSTVDYWTQELLVPAEKSTVRMPMMRLELAISRV